MNDFRSCDTFDEWKYKCFRTSCYNNCIWSILLDKVCCYFCVKNNFYTSFFTFCDVTSDHVCDITFSRWVSSKSHISAEYVACFKQCNVMSSSCCSKCCTHTSRATTDYINLLLSFCFFHSFALTAKNWVC